MNMTKSTNTKIRNILAQEGQANNIKAIKHVIKQVDMLGKTIKHARKEDKVRDMLGKAIKHVRKQEKAIKRI